MSKNETGFWLVFVAGILSAFLGTILTIMFYPSLKQLFGEYTKTFAYIIGTFIAGIFFFLLRSAIARLLTRC